MLRVAVAQLDHRRPREQLQLRLHAVLDACRAWSVTLLVVPARPILVELLATLERPVGLVVIADDQFVTGRLAEPHAVMTVDEFVFRTPSSDRVWAIAARRDANFMILTGACSARDRRHLVRYRRPIVVVNDAQTGGTDLGCGELGHAIERECEGLLVADLGPSGADVRVFARASINEADDPERGEYLGWSRALLREIEGGLDLAGVRARVDAATGLLSDRRRFDRWRASFLRELLIRLDGLTDVESVAAYLRELVVPTEAGARVSLASTGAPEAPSSTERPRAPWIRRVFDDPSDRVVPRLRNLGSVSSQRIAWSPDGSLLAVGSFTDVTIWRIAERRIVAVIDRNHHIEALAWSPDGRELALGPTLGPVTIWSFESLRLRMSIEQPRAGLQSLAWSPDGAWLAGNVGVVWSTRDGSLTWTFADPVDRVRFAADSERLLGRRRTELVVIERGGVTVVREPGTLDAQLLVREWLADDDGFVTVDRAGTVEFHARSGELERSLALGRRFEAVAISLDDTMLAASWEGHTVIYSLTDGRLLSSCLQPSAWLRVLEWSARGDLASLARPGGTLIRSAHGRSPFTLRSSSDLRALRFSWAGDRLAALSGDGVQVWSRDWTPLVRSFGGGVRFAWSPNADRLAIAMRQGHVEIWTDTGESLMRLDEPQTCQSLAWSGDGAQLLVIDGLGNLWRWTNRGRPLAEPERLGYGHYMLSPTGDRITQTHTDRVEIRSASANAEPTVRVRAPARHYYSFVLGWSPDGTWLCNLCNVGFQLIRSADGHRLLGDLRCAIGEERIAWSPCGGMVALVATGCARIHVFEFGDTLRERVEFGCRRATSLTWSPDGEALLIGGEDGVLELRRSSDGELLGLVEAAGETTLVRHSTGAFTVIGDLGDVGRAIEVESSRWLVPLEPGE